MSHEVELLKREVQTLKAELADWKDCALNAENPHPDEEHCTCVPLLRKTIKDFRREIEEYITHQKCNRDDCVACNHWKICKLVVQTNEYDLS